MDDQPIPQPRTTAKRPESTIAQTFAADLDSMFGLDPVVDGLTQTVNQKKASIDSGSMELRELEARLRATEQRLAKVSRSSSPAQPAREAPPPPPPSAAPAPPPQQYRREDQQQQFAGAQSRTSPLTQKPSYPPDRPPTAPSHQPPMPPRGTTEEMMSNMPGQFPPQFRQQQQSMGNDYVMVERGGQRGNDKYNAPIR